MKKKSDRCQLGQYSTSTSAAIWLRTLFLEEAQIAGRLFEIAAALRDFLCCQSFPGSWIPCSYVLIGYILKSLDSGG